MKKLLLVSIVLVAFGILFLTFPHTALAMSGNGTVGSPFVITNITEFQGINGNLSANYVLGNDIDASDTVNWNLGSGFVPIGDLIGGRLFTGSLNGRGHKVYNLYIDMSNPYPFTAIFDNNHGVIQDIGFTNVSITCQNQVAFGFIGENAGSIVDCYITGVVCSPFGPLLSGFSLYNSGGSITHCYSACNLTTSSPYGTAYGFCFGNSGAITSCYWDVNISGTTQSDGGSGNTTSEMQQQSTYVGWDFSNTWYFSPGHYPQLEPFIPIPTPSPFNKSILVAVAVVWICIGLLFMLANAEEGIFVMVIIVLLVIAGVAAIVPFL